MCRLPMDHSQSHEKIVGFDARNKDSLGSTYMCQICMLLLRDPFQLNCGHRICQLCITVDDNSMIKCMKCNMMTPRNEVSSDRGCQFDMATLAILCSFCDWNGSFKDYQEHFRTNHTYPPCEFCDKKFVSNDSHIQHQSECDLMPINCQLKQYGCTEQFLRMNTESHLLTEKHQFVMSSILTGVTSHLRNNTRDDQQLKPTQMDLDLPNTTMSSSTSTNDKLNETIGVLLGSLQALNDDTQQVSSDTLRAQWSVHSLSEDLSKLKLAVQETNLSVEGLKPNQQILMQDVESLKQDVDDQQSVSYDGTIIWRITDIQKKMAAAHSEKQPSVYSQPFYSSPNGYKMRARLYLNGDGNARRSHVSLFFVLMRGEHDAILQFPFNFKVTFCLYDQTDQKRHLIDSFRPDIKSSSFQRPRSEMNIASGIPKFCPVVLIQPENNPYVRNDTMFIKVMVDFNNTPKTLLPYILNINPGLSALTQQLIIRQEAEQRARQQQASLTDSSTDQSTTMNSN